MTNTAQPCSPATTPGKNVLRIPSVPSCCMPHEKIFSEERWEKPGYRLCPYVIGMQETAIGPVPRVRTTLCFLDRAAAVRVRLGIARNTCRVVPGLYCVGSPTPDSAVLVTSNYKLTFDVLRSNLDNMDLWILVLDTGGINVWCAAGKGTFSAEKVAGQVAKSRLHEIVSHRALVLPLLSAPGVEARTVKKICGFSVVWGPIRARDLRRFLSDNMRADQQMRQLTFSFIERAVLVPLEVLLIARPLLLFVAALYILSGVGPAIFSLGQALERGTTAAGFLGCGVLAGAAGVPLLLPWIPGKSFAVKGFLLGGPAAALVATVFAAGLLEAWAGGFMAVAVSSYAAMNFTGATPFTSPSGVEKEMRRYIPVQLAAVVAGISLWAVVPFVV